MCYNVSIKKKKEVYETRFKAKLSPSLDFPTSDKINGFAHSKIPVITQNKPSEIQLFSWGLIPSWVKDETQAKEMQHNTLNAKGETIFEKPSFRGSMLKQRCLVLIDGFYEWRWEDAKGKVKTPYYIHLKEEGPFALGGITATWTNKETGEIINTCSIITTEANPLMAFIHNNKKRMPFILDKNKESTWLDNELTKDQVINCIHSFDESGMSENKVI